jgi:hypothetical protein
MNIALALIKRLVATGQIDADDVAAICGELEADDAAAVLSAWAEGLAGPQEEFKPTLRVVD